MPNSRSFMRKLSRRRRRARRLQQQDREQPQPQPESEPEAAPADEDIPFDFQQVTALISLQFPETKPKTFFFPMK